MTEKNVLTGFSFFSDVDPDTLEAIAGKGKILEFKAEDVIFHVDEPATHFYGLLEGKIDLVLIFKDKVLKTDVEYEEAIQATMVDEEKEIIVDTVSAGQVFGWASIVGPSKRTVNAECSLRPGARPSISAQSRTHLKNASNCPGLRCPVN
jgi:CRP-like cAMP-binding protein